MRLRVATARFTGRGRIDCRRCQHATVFPDGAAAILYDNGFSSLVYDADKMAVLHRCGRLFQWHCRICGPLDDEQVWKPPRTRRRYKPNDPAYVCLVCGGDQLEQRAIPTAAV